MQGDAVATSLVVRRAEGQGVLVRSPLAHPLSVSNMMNSGMFWWCNPEPKVVADDAAEGHQTSQVQLLILGGRRARFYFHLPPWRGLHSCW